MRLIVYPASMLLVLGGIAIAVVLTGRRPAPRPRTNDRDHTARLDLALLASVAAVIAVTLVPTHGGRDLQLVPLKDIIAAFTPPLQRSQVLGAAGNVFLFAPLGAVLRLRGLPLSRAVLAGMVFSTGIEVTQLLVAGRTTSFDDVLLNTLGIVIGHSVAARSTLRDVTQRRS